jgi:hypothetical protein
MHTLLILAGGRRVDALLLSASPDCLRVAIPGRGDLVDLYRLGSGWISEHGNRVEIAALIAPEGVSIARFLPRTHVRALAAV